MDDPPAFGEALKNQREDASNVALFARQVPMTEDQGRVSAQSTDFQAGKVELAHRLAVGIALTVTLLNPGKAARNALAAREGEVVGLPIALQKQVHFSLIPGALLRVQDGANRGLRASSFRVQRYSPRRQ